MVTFSMKCPMCGDPLVRETEHRAGYGEQAIYCQRTVTMTESGRQFNHYSEEYTGSRIIMIVPPYRITTSIPYHPRNRTSSVGIYTRYKTGNRGFFFKTILKVDSEIHPDTDKNILNRIKLLLLMS